MSFPDLDLDASDLGGVITWEPPRDETQVQLYVPGLDFSREKWGRGGRGGGGGEGGGGGVGGWRRVVWDGLESH